ncbi:MAG: 16S rRNA (cytosine(967)-C(5))-methyltransferase RsmB [Notoacmeibacter sp.]|nr:16S rRNA (cytosine(967)-C(5))-methyltransferase RsmB [Notoacmeibacter sp.]
MRDVLRLSSQAIGKTLAGRNLTQTLQTLGRQYPDLSPQQAAAIQDTCFGTLRHLGRLQFILDRLLEKPLRDESLRCLLLVALQLLRQGKTAHHAVVDEAVKTVHALKKTSAKGLVNAVLRNYLRQQPSLERAAEEASEEAFYSYPRWWIVKLREEHPEHWESILQAGNQHPPLSLRVNRRHVSPEAYQRELLAAGMENRLLANGAIQLERAVPVDGLPGFRDGRVSVQDAGAQIAAELLDVRDGQRVLDACAAPGGKTAHLLERADIRLIALDRDPRRLARVEENLTRLGLKAGVLVGDAAVTDTWWDGELFDRILADVPCSASGVVRRHPDIKWLRRPEDIAEFARQQAKILDALWHCLVAGGKLLYATCSIFAEENRLQINAFLDRHADASRLPVTGLDAEDGQLLPNEQHDGFYYALLQKN